MQPSFVRLTLPLAGLNFVNQASRVLIATLGPLLAVEFALSASGLGLLAAVFFASYAAAQLPVGLALDLWGARRVQTVLGLVAALGFAICTFSDGPLLLAIGRMVTGVGIAAGLIAMFKVNTQWYPKDRVAAMTGLGVFVGAMGGVAATVPAAALVPLLGWRGVFWVLAILSCLVSAWIWLSVPEKAPGPPPPRRGLWREIAEFGRIFTHPAFIRFAPAVTLLSAMNFTYQGLWAGPWLRDVGLQGDAARAALLMAYSVGQMLGSAGFGQLASTLQRRGHPAMTATCIAIGLILAVQLVFALVPPQDMLSLGLLWAVFAACGASGPAGYTAIGQRFGPELAGRVATCINGTMLVIVFFLQNAIGWILDLWPRTEAGGWDAAGYAWALMITVGLQALSLVWMLVARRG